MRYLLDTNIISDLIRNPNGRITRRVVLMGESQICTSIVVASELRFRALKADSPQLANKVELALQRIFVLPLEPPVDRVYAQIRDSLETTGQPIGYNDLFIASHAVTLGLTLVTDNVREFSRVDGLQVENWLRE